MRKEPRQQRSKKLVAHILQGAQLCIVENGLNQITTPKIAEKSGVSVGSIYQYFENKEQIIAALLLYKSEKLGADLKQLVMQHKDMAIQQVIISSIDYGFEQLKADQGFFIEVLKSWELYRNSEASDLLKRNFFEIGMYVFNQYYQHLNYEDLKHKSFVIINSTLFTIMRYVEQNDLLIEEQQLKAELVIMITAYLDANPASTQ